MAKAIVEAIESVSPGTLSGRAGTGQGVTVYQEFSGVQYPSAEQRQAMVLELTTALSNA